MKNRKGFTLMEILVVISIIAILAGILMPSVVAVKRMAKRALSEALISNIGMGLETYSSDFSGFYPPDVDDTDGSSAPENVRTGTDLECSAQLLCYFLESECLTDDGRKSGMYLTIKPKNKREEGKNTVFPKEDIGGGIKLTFSEDYVIDAFGTPVLYDERKSEGNEDGMNPLSFVLVSGSAFDQDESVDAETFDGSGTYPVSPTDWSSESISRIDTDPAIYQNDIPDQDDTNDDIYNK